MKPRVDIITMGCSKNLIDSERLIRRLELKGYKTVHNAEIPCGDYVMVNTCGFIGDAKEESINLILLLGRLKEEKKIGRIAVMGCLSERYKDVIAKELPEVDFWYGKFDWPTFVAELPDLSKKQFIAKDWERTLTTPPWSAYVKISEGCNRMCAYCAIPLITGRHRSRPIEEILEEVVHLAESGVKEFNVIAQDLSSYGLDISGRHMLPELIDNMAQIRGVEWIRLHYFYPTDFPMEILDVMNRRPNVCKYIDIALQHISDNVLSPMKRGITKEETVKLLKTIREKVPGIVIRTTVMTGFPGEDEEAFAELKEFVAEQRFERLGGFAYSEEEDTLAARTLTDDIPEDVKNSRLSEIMAIQQEIAEEINNGLVGSRLKVLIEENDGKTSYGRTEFDSPEVDQEVVVEDCVAAPGSFVDVEIIGAAPFELRAKLTASINQEI